ncbi:Mg2+ transporter protein [Wallemia mellicola]|uniref:Magnesium transporter n=1 Tax=Wallemia mellicola TaxID=1708541 RepID=A0A4T0RTX6_9BASI|nr:hypothetical protein E3Q23_03397 [Wallemia mellicola]TIB73749.1 hypothetical protein E3Q24_00957 [Wallemia mellicola]TIB76408.1 Mg2+ transporter protein [Wallemia mellicola]TIB82263.1 Mg2+ transporter protein [Wallemia mellicola]TIB84993.1 Mg2+ transporter protein [Wallemia mellicola]
MDIRKNKQIRQSFAPAPSPTPSLPQLSSSEDSPRKTSTLKLVLYSLPSLQPSELPNSTRTQICKSASIPYRDLRVLDSPLSDDEPSILIRDSCIVYAGEGVRAIVRSDRLLVVRGENDVGIGHNPATIEIIHTILLSLENRLTSNDFTKRTYPFEFNALETLLMHSFSLLEKRVASLTLSTDTLLETLRTKGIEHDQLLDMLDLSTAVDKANRKVRGMHKAIEEVLREEEDMAAMYLTAKHFGKPRNEGEDDEVELLLEAYLKQSSTLCSAVAALTTRLQSTSRHIDLVMAATRNRLLHLEIQLAVVTAALGLGSFFTGLLGMNLMNHFEEHWREGSFAEVYLVGWKSPKLRLQTGVAAPISQMQINNNRPEYTNKHLVAIKRMKKSFKDWKECEKLKELKSLLAIPQHPNLIPLYDAFLHPTTKELYFVFESMEGNLYQLTKSRRGRPLAQGLVASLFRQTVAGLSHIHRSGYFHRDMKPENLLITTTGLTDYPSLSNSLERDVTVIVKLADFGLARESDSKPPYTEYVSTRWYRAPEVLLRAKDYGPPVDLWALGTILAEIVNLKPLFPGQSEVDQVYKICHVLGNPTSQSTYHPVTNTLIGGGDWQHGLKLAATIGFQFPQVGLQSAAFFY